MVDSTTQAHHPLRARISGVPGGDWCALIDMLTPDVAFSLPVEGFLGNRGGRSEADRFFAFLSTAVRAGLTPTAAVIEGDRVAFEVALRGRWQGRPFQQALFLVFVLRERPDRRVPGVPGVAGRARPDSLPSSTMERLHPDRGPGEPA
jgi:hypothetical protein